MYFGFYFLQATPHMCQSNEQVIAYAVAGNRMIAPKDLYGYATKSDMTNWERFIKIQLTTYSMYIQHVDIEVISRQV